MNALVLTVAHHVYGNQLVSHLLRSREVAAVWESDVLLPRQPFTRALRRYWRSSGPGYVLPQGVKQWVYRIERDLSSVLGQGRMGDSLFDYRRAARVRGVPVARVRDVNAPEAMEQVRRLAPDLVVSLYFNQILAPATLALFPAGGINGHPAPLPRYRGVSPVFWALANGETEAGFTIHRLDASIDTGRVLAQTRLAIDPQDTEHSLYWRLTRASLPLWDTVLDALARGEEPKPVATEGSPSYFSLPTREAVARFRRNGRRFFTLRQLVSPASP